MERLLSLCRAAVDKYEMIAPGDRIAVGVSGGKDSLALLCVLAKLRRFYPAPFSLVAVSLDYRFFGQDADYAVIAALCKTLDVEFQVRRTDLWRVIFEERREKNPCALCAKMRRGILHDTAKANGCNKVALGHHADDAVETLLMNLFQNGTLGCFSPVSYLSRKEITVIRPLVFATEAQVAAAAAKARLPVLPSACPADKQTDRQKAKETLLQLESAYPQLRKKLLGAMERSHLSDW